MVISKVIPVTLVTLTALVALDSAASAEALREPYDAPPVETEDESPSFNMFGFDMSVGALPINGTDTLAMSIGLAVEHPVFKKTRVLGEYAWMWLERRDASTAATPTTVVPRPDEHGSGHRAALGLRRELIAKGGRRSRAFIDGELGTMVALVNSNMTGASVIPGVFTGLRAGYDLYTDRDESPSGTFETAFLLRAIALREGVGLTFGLGMYWGN